MPAAKTGSKAKAEVVEAAAPAKPKKPAKAEAEVIVFPQPDVIEVGRFYEVIFPKHTIYGELTDTNDTSQFIQKWVEGSPAGTESVVFAEHSVREISRETCFELSHSLMNAQ